MTYCLGIDLGTTYTAAAAERAGVVEALTLGNRTASVPSVVFLRDDGEILVGEAATRRAASDPGRVAREFKRRVGDPTPIILGGTPYAAEMLMARLLRWAVDRVREQQGEAPRAIALTHPANWGPYKLDLLRQAVRQVDVDAALTLAEPVAAATFYASQRRLEPGSVVAVYDLGGGTFDAAMVRRTDTGFDTIGTPEGIERLGGIDFDEAVFAHVRGAVGEGLERLDPEEPAAQAAVARLRQECIDAKEALSSDTDVSIPVLLPGLQTEVRLTRSEFEAMIRPAISETIVALRRAIRSAEVANDDITAVLLVGGSSRIPLVAQMVGAELGRPIAIDAHPKDAIAFGAAIAVASRRGTATPESVTTVLPDATRPPPPTMAARPGQADPRPAPPRPAPPRPAAPAAAGAAGAAAGFRPPPPQTGGPPRPAPPPGARPSPPVPAAVRPGPPGASPTPGAGTPAGRPAAPVPAGAPAAREGSPPPGDTAQQAATGGGAPAGHAPTPLAARLAQPPPRPATSAPPPAQAPPRPATPAPLPTAHAPGPGTAPPSDRPGPSDRLVPPGGDAFGTRGPTSGERPATPTPFGPLPRAGGSPGGAVSSGGYPPVAGRNVRTGASPAVWIAVSAFVVLVIVLAVVFVVRGGDDNEPTETTLAADDYSPALRRSFVSTCVSQADGSVTSEQCGCTYDKFEATVPFERFKEIDQELKDDPENPPQELVDIVQECVSPTG
jgi:actin-like ATPase involved in cell morphogenesis